MPSQPAPSDTTSMTLHADVVSRGESAWARGCERSTVNAGVVAIGCRPTTCPEVGALITERCVRPIEVDHPPFTVAAPRADLCFKFLGRRGGECSSDSRLSSLKVLASTPDGQRPAPSVRCAVSPRPWCALQGVGPFANGQIPELLTTYFWISGSKIDAATFDRELNCDLIGVAMAISGFTLLEDGARGTQSV